MKSKYHRITRYLPTAVFIAASLPFAAQATVFITDSDGNANVVNIATWNGTATTITANQNAGLSTNPNPLVSIISGITLTGDAGYTSVLNITAANYTVTNAGGLIGTNHHGILSNNDFTLTNSGTIAGGTTSGRRGIQSTLATITNNASGVISGTDDAINFSADGGSITNFGIINGNSESSYSDGIRGRDGIAINNKTNFNFLVPISGGSITGTQYGIYADARVTVNNQNLATITAINEDAIRLDGDGGIITNQGTITALGSSSSSDGIRGRDNLIVHNNNNYGILLLSAPVSGGTINAAHNGIYADDYLTVTNQSRGSITGGQNGIDAGYGLDLTNDGTITGTNVNGVHAGDGSYIVNNSNGSINGSSNGIDIDTSMIPGEDSATTQIFNYGEINADDGDGIDGDSQVQIVTNEGYIYGDSSAITLWGGNDVINLNYGSQIDGDIHMGDSGNDVMNIGEGQFTGEDDQNIVWGNVYGVNTINKHNGGYAFINDVVGEGFEVEVDTINVHSGGLYINADVFANSGEDSTDINVYRGGEIGGTGIWDANIDLTASDMLIPLTSEVIPIPQYAVISPGETPIDLASDPRDSIGQLTINGDVTLGENSIYRWNTDPQLGGWGSDKLILTKGNVFTAGGGNFQLAPTDVNAPIRDTIAPIVVVQTDTLLGSGGWTKSLYSQHLTTPEDSPFTADAHPSNPIILGFVNLIQVDGGTDWALTVKHDYGKFGANHNQVAAGNMLNGLVNTATGDLADLLASMDYSDPYVTQATLAALDPGNYMASAAGLVANNYQLHRAVETHNAAVRSDSVAAPAPAPAAPSAKGAIAPAPMVVGCTGTSNVWGSFSYDWQDLNTSHSGFDQNGETASFIAGVDFTVANNFRLGVVAEGAQTSWDNSDSFGTDIDTYRFGLYANYGAATGWFVDALLGYNTNDVNQSQGASMGNYYHKQSGSYTADGWQGMITAGNTIATSSAGSFSPFIGLEWQQLSTDSFTAKGSSLLPVSIDSFDIDSIRGLIGVKWDMTVAQNVKLYASAAYAYEFAGDAASTKVKFAGGSYNADGTDLGDSVLLSAGVRWAFMNCASLDVGYRGEFAMDEGVDSNGANIGLNYSF